MKTKPQNNAGGGAGGGGRGLKSGGAFLGVCLPIFVFVFKLGRGQGLPTGPQALEGACFGSVFFCGMLNWCGQGLSTEVCEEPGGQTDSWTHGVMESHGSRDDPREFGVEQLLHGQKLCGHVQKLKLQAQAACLTERSSSTRKRPSKR